MYAINLGLILLGVFTFTEAVLNDDTLNVQWQKFKLRHGKTYSDETEEKFRKMIFYDNWLMIAEHNQKYERGQVSYGMAINHFGDLLNHEYKAATRCLIKMNWKKIGGYKKFHLKKNGTVPSAINWVKKGYVTPVKNQGECGSCWSFGATGALEGQHKRKTGKLVSLSEQNLIDCAGKKYENQGCEGGLPQNAFEYINDNKGIDTELAYPYEGVDGDCRFKSDSVGATDSGVVSIEAGDEEALKAAVGTMGPVAVAIDASKKSFGFYKKGVYDEPDCSSDDLDHAVLAVGYGNYRDKDFWLAKNSWGTGWGLGGFIRMSRNNDNQCGIATLASYPEV